MILVVFGTIPVPFDRLAKKIDELARDSAEEIFVQSGYTEYPFRHARSTAFISSSAMQQKIAEASLVITHGGYGTIYEALQKNKKIIVVPRAAGEHNHSQTELVQALEKTRHVLAAYDTEDLVQKITEVKDFVPRQLLRGNAGELINHFIRNAFKESFGF